MPDLDPRSRILAALLFCLVTVGLRQPQALAAALLLGGSLAAAARLPAGLVLRRLLALDGFMLAMLAALPFTMPDAGEGLAEAARILARANAVALAVLGLLGGLGEVRLGYGLRGLGLPDAFVQLFLLTVRYIAVIEQEYARLRLAMRARAFRLTAAPRGWAVLGTLFGMLLVRSLERAERIQAAMRCRGFTGRFPAPEARWRRPDALFGLGALATAAGLLALELA